MLQWFVLLVNLYNKAIVMKDIHCLKLALIFSFILFLGLGKTVVAQQLVIIEGRIVNKAGDSLSNAHVLNLTKKIGTTSNQQGVFKIIASPGDSMMISSMGYKNYRATVPKVLPYKVLSIKVTMINDTFLLTETIIRAFPATYEQFKKEFVTLKLKKNPNEKLFAKIIDKQYNPKGGIVMKGPISAIYDAFSREGKLKRKMAELQYQDNLRGIVYDKIPKDLLIKAYHQKDEAALEQFLEFCQLPENLILNGSTYDLLVFMNQCYQRYPKTP